ncbi:MAG: peptidoglycan DD-metalloendopeptidase family protein [Rudaea sp.]
MLHSYNPNTARLLEQVRWLIEKARGTQAEHRSNIPLLARLTAHLGIIALVIFGLLVSSMDLRAAGPDSAAGDQASGELPPISFGEDPNSGNLILSTVPFTIKQQQAAPSKPRTDIVEYTVGPGDTVTGIAARFHVSADSILWANAKLEDNPDMLSIGQTLNIPPTTGVLYTVQKGDIVQTIAARFKAKADDIMNDPFNQSNHDFKSNPPILAVGTFIMVPGGSKPFVVRQANYSTSAPRVAPRGTSNFITPVGACVTQNFWARHSGIDLAAPIGTPVYASDSGYVAFVGWDNTGYGNSILLNHGNGYLTRYGHLSRFNVEPGQAVKKGDLIGRVGSTGHSTGPHLHFEIIFKGVFRNPAYFIKVPGRCPGY